LRLREMKKVSITNSEINKIAEKCSIRDRAFLAVIRQSGLKPNTIRQLRIKHLEKIRDPNPPIPCKIDVSKQVEQSKFGRHPSFIAEEAVKYIKNYFRLRKMKEKEEITPESLLFTIHKKQNEQIKVKEMNRVFKRIAHRLNKEKPVDFELDDLRRFFKEKTAAIGLEHANYLMGNPSSNYTPEDDEFYRTLYNEIARNSLNIEQTPLLYTREIEISDLKKQRDKDDEYIGDFLSLIHESDGNPNDPEETAIGDNLLELWKKASRLQSETLLDRWENNSKYPPYVDIPLTLTNIFKHIIEQYEDSESLSSET
jgi:hypothetical protein